MFAMFAKLPPELREMIWIWSLPEARFLFLKRCNEGSWQWRASNQQTPSLLHVSQESRLVCLRHYTRVQTSDGAPCTYINYNLDSIFIHPPCPIVHLPRSTPQRSHCAGGLNLDRVRHLIVPAVDWYIYPSHSFSILDFENVCTLTFFLDIQDFNEDKVVLHNESPLETLCRLLSSTGFADLCRSKWFQTHLMDKTLIEPPDICTPEWYQKVWAAGDIAAVKFKRTHT